MAKSEPCEDLVRSVPIFAGEEANSQGPVKGLVPLQDVQSLDSCRFQTRI